MIRPGDLIRLAGDVALTAEVLTTSREGATRGHLLVRPVCRGHERVVRDVLVRDVVRHWPLARAYRREEARA